MGRKLIHGKARQGVSEEVEAVIFKTTAQWIADLKILERTIDDLEDELLDSQAELLASERIADALKGEKLRGKLRRAAVYHRQILGLKDLLRSCKNVPEPISKYIHRMG